MEIRINDGGFSYICVQDNGKGITENNFSFLSQYHTSTKTMKNLSYVYGFGKSLATISCFAPIRITSRSDYDQRATTAVFSFTSLIEKKTEN